jgi:pimeloyl-ACP methyl ester carboxylesterase
VRTLQPRAAAVGLVLFMTACGSPSPTSTLGPLPSAVASPPASFAERTPRPTPTLPPDLQGSEAVQFLSTDGVELEGRVFGSGSVAIVLAHGSVENGQGSWFPFARALADDGYLAMTLNLRGFCPRGFNGCSKGQLVPPDTWQDVMGAAALMRDRGAEKVFLIGASLGARSCVWAASRPGVTLDGVIGISTPKNAAAAYRPEYDFTADVIGAIHVPILFVAGDRDESYAAEATVMYEWANDPKKLSIVSSAVHGAGLLEDPNVSEVVLNFLRDHT